MPEQNEAAQSEVVEEIGEEYVEEVQEEVQEEVIEEEKEVVVDSEEKKEETKEETKERSKDELIELAQEFYGVKKDEVLIDKDGKLKLIVKINGKKRLVDPQKDVIKGFNLNQAGYEKLNEGKKLVKQVQGFFDEAKQDPKKLWELADKLGVDKYELAKGLLEEAVTEAEMPEDQKRLRDVEKREASLKEKEDKDKEKIAQGEQDKIKQEEMVKYDKELTEAMIEHGFQKSTKGTKSHILMAAIGELMVANQLGRELSCKDAVSRAKTKWREQVLGIFDEIEEDHIFKIIPDKLVKAIRKASLNEVDVGIPTSNVSDSVGQEIDLDEIEEDKRPRKKESVADYFSSLI